ncbi:putative translation initiation inhibitor, yjgF family [Acaromyces ingoldii]|uniref:Putative translation initiation inhibitor, yjgF family n=1 Tax=Acaromyces ingoldii TaxID=215250 RepID=A0A316YFH2_9BASI|nr:putative translation initiation inhibitor, yjgF family [Acaromyces ingoldii]PWN86833.1 putative translation initiation inhibitor, yjgF family [Acaromyces ingoldii]
MSDEYELKQVVTEPDHYAQFCISQGIKVGNLVFVSGQVALGEDASIVGKGDFPAQIEQAFLNLSRVLQSAGSDLSKVAKVTIFLVNMKEHFGYVRQARAKYFSVPYPADTIVEVKSLYHPDVLIEIEAIAVAAT